MASMTITNNNGLNAECMDYEVEGARPRGRPKKTWTEIVENDCKARGLREREREKFICHKQNIHI